MTVWDDWMTARDTDARKHVKTGLKYLSCMSCGEGGGVKDAIADVSVCIEIAIGLLLSTRDSTRRWRHFTIKAPEALLMC